VNLQSSLFHSMPFSSRGNCKTRFHEHKVPYCGIQEMYACDCSASVQKQVSRDLMCYAAKWCRETRDDHMTAARETDVSHLRSHEEFVSALLNTYSV
jgi:hypothetical protein